MLDVVKSKNVYQAFFVMQVICFCIYIFCKKIWESQLIFFAYDIVNITTNIAYIVLMIGVLYNVIKRLYSIKEISIYAILLIILFLIYKNTGFNEPFIILGYMVVFKNVDRDFFIKCVFFTLLASFILIITLALINVIPNHPEMQVRYGEERARWFLGYNWNNMAMNHYLSIVLLYMLYKKKLKVYDYAVIIMIDVLLFIFTDSKCAAIMVCFTLLLYIFFEHSDVVYKKIGKMIVVFAPLASIVMILLTYFYNKNNKIWNIINNMITGRLRLAHDGYRLFDITLLGHMTDMNIEDGTYNFVDISYLNILFNYGVVLLIVVLIVYVIYMYIVYKKDDKLLLIGLFISLVHSMIEPHLISISNWPYIVLFVSIIFDKLNIDKKIVI